MPTVKTSFVSTLLWLYVAGHGAIVLAQSAGTFAATGAMSTPRVGHTATLLPNGKVLIAGGVIACSSPLSCVGADSAELYDPATGTFATSGPYITDTHLYGFNTCQGSQSALLADGRVLIVFESGGAELYDPSRDAFTRTSNPITALF